MSYSYANIKAIDTQSSQWSFANIPRIPTGKVLTTEFNELSPIPLISYTHNYNIIWLFLSSFPTFYQKK